MYICEDCGATFEEPGIIKEAHGFTDGRYEELPVCPHCHGGAFTLADNCDYCDEAVPADALEEFEGSMLCPKCYDAKLKEIEQIDTDNTHPDDLSAGFWKDWVAARRAAYMQPQFVRPGPQCSMVLDKLPCWFQLRGLLQDMLYQARGEYGLVAATHDPSHKTEIERMYDEFVIETILDTGVVAGQYRRMVAHILQWYAWSTDCAPMHKILLDSLAQTLDPTVQCPHVATTHPLLDDSDEEYTGSVIDDIYSAAVDNERAVLQIGDQVWTLPSTLIQKLFNN